MSFHYILTARRPEIWKMVSRLFIVCGLLAVLSTSKAQMTEPEAAEYMTEINVK